MFLGVVRFSRIVRLPTAILRFIPSVRNTARAGTCSLGLGGHLLAESQQIGRISAGRLNPQMVLAGQRLGNLLGRRREQPELGMIAGVVVEARSKAAYQPAVTEALQRHSDRGAIAKIQEMNWREHPAPLVAINSAKYLAFNGLRIMWLHSVFTKSILFL